MDTMLAMPLFDVPCFYFATVAPRLVRRTRTVLPVDGRASIAVRHSHSTLV